MKEAFEYKWASQVAQWAKNLPSDAKDAKLIPGWGTKILHAASPY